MLALVAGLRFNRSVSGAVDVWDVVDRLEAAADDRDAYHHDLCTQFDGPGSSCSCGGPALLADAAQVVRGLLVEQAITRARQAA